MDEQDCVVVGGGPGGVVLAYLLARAGRRVTLLEARGDFDRRFRGDALAPAVLDFLDALGLADEILARPHSTATAFTWHTSRRAYRVADYSTSSTHHPHYVLIPQPELLGLLAEKAAGFGGFTLRTGARVNGVLMDAGRVTGVRYRADGAHHEVKARLVVGTDGRFSQMRRLGRFESEELGAGLDILWFEVPRHPDDPPQSGLDYHSLPGRALAVLGQGRTWQLGWVIPTGSVDEARTEGIGPLVDAVHERLPWLDERMAALTDFTQLTLLNVRITRLARWYRPGLLLLGDAAHVISPVGGNGINLAIADAADAANVLAPLLPDGSPEALDAACAGIEARRRAVSDAEQDDQVRAERGTLERLRRGDPEPAWPLKVAAALPPLARAVGRRNATGIAIPPPSALVLGGPAGGPTGAA